MITIEVLDDKARAQINELQGKLKNPVPLYKVCGREIANVLKTHFRMKDQTANRLGGNRTHFWREVGRSVNQPELLVDGVRVSVSHPVIRHKVTGGTITAKRAKYLTIPLTSEAYGRRASVYERATGRKLFFVSSKQGRKFLAVQKAGGGIEPQYLLKPSVNQAADPTAMPDAERLREAVVRRAISFLGRQHE